jgi:hypothetical protein
VEKVKGNNINGRNTTWRKRHQEEKQGTKGNIAGVRRRGKSKVEEALV